MQLVASTSSAHLITAPADGWISPLRQGRWVHGSYCVKACFSRQRAAVGFEDSCAVTSWCSRTSMLARCIAQYAPLIFAVVSISSNLRSPYLSPKLRSEKYPEVEVRGYVSLHSCLPHTEPCIDDLAFQLVLAYPRGGDKINLKATSARDCQLWMQAIDRASHECRKAEKRAAKRRH